MVADVVWLVDPVDVALLDGDVVSVRVAVLVHVDDAVVDRVVVAVEIIQLAKLPPARNDATAPFSAATIPSHAWPGTT